MIENPGILIGFAVIFVLLLLGEIHIVLRTFQYLNRPAEDRDGFEALLLILAWGLLIVLGVISGLLFMILLLVVAYICMQNLRTKQQGFLWMLAVAAERNIPLSGAVTAYSAEVGGGYGRRLREFASLLDRGASPPDALREIPLLVPKRYYPILRISFESGSFAKGLREAAAARGEQQDLWGSLSAKVLYVVCMMWCGLAILSFIVVKIIPSFEKIFHEFSTGLPSITIALLGLSRWLALYWFLAAPFVILFIGFSIYCVLKYIGLPLSDLPGFGRLARRNHTAAILDSLALVVERDRPIVQGIGSLAMSYPDGSIDLQLRRVWSEVQQGSSWYESLFRHQLLSRTDYAVLESAERAGNLAWAMKELADSNRRRLAYRMNAIIQVLFPPIVICFGAMVLFVVLALFMPLITLISRMS